MKTRNINVLVIEPNGKLFTTLIDANDAFDCIKGLVECEYLEYHHIAINHHLFGAWMDDRGQLEEKPKTAYSNRYGYLFGNIVISHVDDIDDEDFNDLTDEELGSLVLWFGLGRLKNSEKDIVVLNDDISLYY